MPETRFDSQDPLRCRCDNELPCPNQATGEDMRCDTCRQAKHGHLGSPDGSFVVPITFES